MSKSIAELLNEITELKNSGKGVPVISINGTDGHVWFAGGNFIADANGNVLLSGTVYASGGEFTGKVTATSGTFNGDVNAENFKASGTYSHKIVSYNLNALAGQVIGNFPYSVYRITPQSNNQQLLIGRGDASIDGKVIHIHNTHASYNIKLINGDYLVGTLGEYTIQPGGTIQLIWSQDSKDWIILGYIQTPSTWNA